MNTRQRTAQSHRDGFTLIELLLVITILSALASIVIFAVNPTKQLGGARNAQRWSDVSNIMEAFAQYSVDSGGLFQPSDTDSGCTIPVAPADPKKVCKGTIANGSGVGQCGDTTNVPDSQCVYTAHLIGPYLVEITPDPKDAETGDEARRVDYRIRLDASGIRLQVDSPNAEQGVTIYKTR